MMTWSLRSVCNFICCGCINFDTPEQEESNPLLANNGWKSIDDEYWDSSQIKEYDSPDFPVSSRKCNDCSHRRINAVPEINSYKQKLQMEKSTLSNNDDRETQIEKCRKDLTRQLGNVGQNVKRAKSLPSNTSVRSQKSTTSKHENDFEPLLHESCGDTRWRSRLSHHVLRHLATPYDSGLMMNNVPYWKQLDNLIMDDRPPKMK